MSIINPYATLAEYKSRATPRGQTVTTDATDDVLISDILGQAARDIDTQCHRTFYPRYEKRYFDVPVYQNSPRNLFLDDDLLEVVTVTNGDNTVVSPTVYNLKPKNYSPHYAIQIIGPTSIFWIFNGIGNIEKVISVEEQRAWLPVGTLSTAMTTTTGLSFAITAGHSITADTIVKVDSEIMNISATTTVTMTPMMRGDNGSTAATHLINSVVYQWMVQPEIKLACLQRAEKIYQERLGVFVKSDTSAKYSDPDLTGFVRII
jgi:hypothetical protein